MSESEHTSELTPRSAQETAQRVLALLTVVGRVHDPEGSVAWMREHNLDRYLSPAEKAFVELQSPPEESRVDFSWRAEALVSLLWALQGLQQMPPLHEQCDVFGLEMVSAALNDPQTFVEQARLLLVAGRGSRRRELVPTIPARNGLADNFRLDLILARARGTLDGDRHG